MRVLVTGGTGFVGQWLARSLVAAGDTAILAERPEAAASRPKVLTAAEWDQVQIVPLDVRDGVAVRAALEGTTPDAIVHLAGISFPPAAERGMATAYEINVVGCVNVLGAAADLRARGDIDPTVLVIGSAAQYGSHDPSAMPLDEDAAQRPVNVYGATKAAQEVAALHVGRSTGLRVVCTRSFNHSGVGQASTFVMPALVERALALRGMSSPVLAVGSDAVRDYLHVTDAVAAYRALLDRGRSGEVYNVASGVGVSVWTLALDILRRVGVAADVTIAEELVRPGDTPVLIGSSGKLAAHTGWRPSRTYEAIIDDLIHAATR